MSEYSISVSNGRIIGDSEFFLKANQALSKECKRLCNFTDELDRNKAQKKECIAEYKCAKYRYAAVSLIHSIIMNNNRCRKIFNLKSSHYLLTPFDDMFKEKAENLALYESAPENEKPDYSLYYMLLTFTEKEITKMEEELPIATDWEKVELDERMSGLNFAKECLDEAWQKRKDVIE